MGSTTYSLPFSELLGTWQQLWGWICEGERQEGERGEDLWDKLDGSDSAQGSCANLLSLCATLQPEFMHERPICNKVLGAVG